MLSEGIGEKLTPLPDLPPLWVLLIKPDFSISTAYVYQNLHWKRLAYHPNTVGAADAINRRDVIGLAKTLSNVLETVAFPEHPELPEIKDFFLQNGAIGSLMSGSGPTIYGLYQDEILANIACKTAQEKYPEYETLLCQTKIPEK